MRQFRVLALVTALLAASPPALSAAAPAATPNLLVIISDDQAWADYGFMGHPSIATPSLDRLAAQSLTFTRGYSPVPLCRPSLAAIATGLYPHQHQDPERANRFAPRSKLTPYEGGHRTPIMISWPGHVNPRRDRDHLASNIDLWPTLAALLKTPAPKSLPGVNLTDATAVARRTAIFGEQYAHNIADVDAPTRSLEHRWIIDGWMKLIVPDLRNRPDEKPELYDLQNDPWEKTDLAAKNPERVRQLQQKLDAWWTPPVAAK